MNDYTRRDFIKAGILAAGAASTLNPAATLLADQTTPRPSKKITIKRTSSNFEREPLIRPFGFKGGYMTEIWQTAAMIESDSGVRKVGVCTQNVLWSDAAVFASHSEAGGNGLMYALSEFALNLIVGQSFTSPVEMLDRILPEVLAYGRKITGNDRLRTTFGRLQHSDRRNQSRGERRLFCDEGESRPARDAGGDAGQRHGPVHRHP
jgi:hypothetical protein